MPRSFDLLRIAVAAVRSPLSVHSAGSIDGQVSLCQAIGGEQLGKRSHLGLR